ncbi:hypothetical protein [uncultured Croceicoccus sp.]|uniref:hypothetical protein n=1 Tax=uncultured Croceicoccus sp. TaxID=1295329 RepID=UPI00261C9BFF|nr:hypothetical protein [uncultured Croceicoccus sp.]
MTGPMISRNRTQAMMWSAAVLVTLAVCFALMLQVKGVKSDIAATERQILQTKQELIVLETEFQTRARQQQLVRWNEVEFGYVAPKADQFFETRQELAMLGKPVDVVAPAPMRMADAQDATHDADETGEAPVRMAAADNAAAPIGMMRQLVARDNARGPSAAKAKPTRVEPSSLPAIPAGKAVTPRNFAERFDLDAVLAKAEGAD